MIKSNFCHIISCAISPLSTLFHLVSLSCLTQKFPTYLLATKDVLVSSELSGFSKDLEILDVNIVQWGMGCAFIVTFSPISSGIYYPEWRYTLKIQQLLLERYTYLLYLALKGTYYHLECRTQPKIMGLPWYISKKNISSLYFRDFRRHIF